MPLPIYSTEDYATQFQRLLPRGRVWHRGLLSGDWSGSPLTSEDGSILIDEDTGLPIGSEASGSLSPPLVQAADIEALMPTWSRLHARLNDLIAETFPCTLNPPELLTEWERSLGLPDPCVQPPLNSIQQRVAAVCAKFSARGGQSKEYFYALANALGYEITITEYTPFRTGINRAGDPLAGEAWAYAWTVNVANVPQITYFRVGLSVAGDPLRSWGNNMLECVLNAVKPAHTVLQFAYGVGSFVLMEGAFVPIVSGVVTTLVTLPLSHGDWQVWGVIAMHNVSGTQPSQITHWKAWIEREDVTPPGTEVFFPSRGAIFSSFTPFAPPPAIWGETRPLGIRRVDLTGLAPGVTLNVYIGALIQFPDGVIDAAGALYARRVG
jgi:uncharacterized protein YmfQ (DUF2313 family)